MGGKQIHRVRGKKILENKRKLKTKKKSIRRGRKKSAKHHDKLTIIGTNCAGLLSKMDSFANVVKELKPGIILLQETKFRRKGVSLNY